VFERCEEWLPGTVPQSVLVDVCEIQLPNIMGLHSRQRCERKRELKHTEWGSWLENGRVGSKAELARQADASRAAVTLALSVWIWLGREPRQVKSPGSSIAIAERYRSGAC
jgi:hypothetical protein